MDASITFPNFKSQDFTSSGSFVVPNGQTMIRCICVGGGGGGGGGGRDQAGLGSAGGDGAGGGEGVLPVETWLKVTPGETLTVTIGVVGAGGSVAGDGNPATAGSDGGTSSVKRSTTTLIQCRGGRGAPSGSATQSADASPYGYRLGSNGGNNSTSTNGFTSPSGVDSLFNGPGGAGGTTFNSGSGTIARGGGGGSGGFEGAGGHGGNGGSTNPTAGIGFGAGGGGGAGIQAGASGGPGLVRFIWPSV